jgi:tripartite ATP-independent transporter DctM subunit
MMLMGVPIGAALGLAGAAAIALANADSQWFGLLAVPQNFYAGLGKYPLLAIPMFVLVGSIFDRSGVALRLVNFAVAIVGRGPGMLPLVAIAVAMFLGGISGSGPANAAAVGAVMIAAMSRAGYPPSFSASVVGAAAATDILIPPSVAFIVYSVLVPGASVPALFAAGMVPGVLAGVALIVPAVWMARKHKMGALEATMPRPPFWKSLREATWGLAAPVLILGGMRAGWFTPTEAAVVAVFYGLFVGMVIHRTIKVRDLFPILRESGELSAVILHGGVAGGHLCLFAVHPWRDRPGGQGHRELGLGEYGVLALLIVLLITVGMFLDGISIFLIFVPLLLPIMQHYQWDPVWFGVILTLKVALGQFTPPLAVNLMVSCRIAGVRMEETVRWVGWMLLAMFLVMVAGDRLPATGPVAARVTWATDFLAYSLFYIELKETESMKLRTFLTSAVAAVAAALAFTAPAALAQTAYKSEYRMSLVLGTAFPWGKGGELWANLVKRAHQGPHQHQAVSRRVADPGRPDARIQRAAPGRDRHGGGLDHQLVAAGQATQPVLAALPDARLRGHRRPDPGRRRQEDFCHAGQGRRGAAGLGRKRLPRADQLQAAIKSPEDLKGMKIRVVGSPCSWTPSPHWAPTPRR